MELGRGLGMGCRSASGDREDKGRHICKTYTGTNCNFETGLNFNSTTNGLTFAVNGTGTRWERCLFLGQGLTSVTMIYLCLDTNDRFASCANNCLGVEASDIVAG